MQVNNLVTIIFKGNVSRYSRTISEERIGIHYPAWWQSICYMSMTPTLLEMFTLGREDPQRVTNQMIFNTVGAKCGRAGTGWTWLRAKRLAPTEGLWGCEGGNHFSRGVSAHLRKRLKWEVRAWAGAGQTSCYGHLITHPGHSGRDLRPQEGAGGGSFRS